MEKVTGNNVRSLLKKLFQRYFVDAMSAMALGLFSSLIIGLIMSQLSQVPFLTFLAPYSEMAAASSPVVGSAIGAAIAWGCSPVSYAAPSDTRQAGRWALMWPLSLGLNLGAL